jgi:hypothetical protein
MASAAGSRDFEFASIRSEISTVVPDKRQAPVKRPWRYLIFRYAVGWTRETYLHAKGRFEE